MKVHKFPKYSLYFLGSLLLLLSLCSCDAKEDLTVAPTTTYFFGLYPEASRGRIEIDTWSDEMEFKLESSGANRQYVIMLFLDYEQIPFSVEGETYEQYYIDVNQPDYSRTFSFHLVQEPAPDQIHKLNGIVAAYSNIHLAEQADLDYMDDYSIIPCYDLIINDATTYLPSEAVPEEPTSFYDSYSSGIIVNCYTDKLGTYIPEPEIHVKEGKNLTIQYNAGGYSDNNTFLLLATAGFQQMDLNGKKFAYFQGLPVGQQGNGFLEMSTPDAPGSYEVIVYMLPEPFSTDGISEEMPDGSFRFTLIVDE